MRRLAQVQVGCYTPSHLYIVAFGHFLWIGFNHVLDRIHSAPLNLTFGIRLGTLSYRSLPSPISLAFLLTSLLSVSSPLSISLRSRTRPPYSSSRVVATSLRRCDVPLAHYFRGRVVATPQKWRDVPLACALPTTYLSCIYHARSGRLSHGRNARSCSDCYVVDAMRSRRRDAVM